VLYEFNVINRLSISIIIISPEILKETPKNLISVAAVIKMSSDVEYDISKLHETECVMALQGYPTSLILAPIESAYATSYRSSIVTLVLSCPVEDRPNESQ